MKDNFSTQANIYAQFRPQYPAELYDFILQHVENKAVAWDCATGNGQAARVLATHFERVEATDISAKQIEHAPQIKNVHYSIQAAEQTTFQPQTFDLITVAQAAHWFRFEQFYAEVQRVAKPKCLLAIWGYGLHYFENEWINHLFLDFYKNKIGSYWDFERAYIDAHYQTLPFPFAPLPTPQYQMSFTWQIEHFEGYLNSWSAVQHFIRKNGENPVPAFLAKIRKYWQADSSQTVTFPIFLKMTTI